jgi:hypothetical protein
LAWNKFSKIWPHWESRSYAEVSGKSFGPAITKT